METSLTDVPDELITHILQHTLSEHASLCVGLIASCKKLHALSREDALWEAYHVAHWGQPGRSGRVASSWYAECKRRHTQDADAVTCVHELSHAVTRSAAWKRLVSYGEEALGRVCALCSEEAADPAVRAEAEKAAVALNQSVVRREWVENLARLQRPSREAGPAYEDGALLLVRLYQTAASLKANGPHGATRSVTDALDSLAARLRATLEASGELEQGPISAVSAVRALSSLLFAEEGFGGNVEDYYNYQNSLLDHVITMKKGIPISLSVLFAAVCSRVGVRAPCLFFSSRLSRPNPITHPITHPLLTASSSSSSFAYTGHSRFHRPARPLPPRDTPRRLQQRAHLRRRVPRRRPPRPHTLPGTQTSVTTPSSSPLSLNSLRFCLAASLTLLRFLSLRCFTRASSARTASHGLPSTRGLLSARRYGAGC